MAISTRTKIARMHRKRPHITAPEIAEELGISRQRVWQLATMMGINLRVIARPRPVVGTCAICGKTLTYPNTTTHAKCHYVQAVCAGCKVRFTLTRTNRERSHRVYHNKACFDAHAPGPKGSK